MELNDIAEMLCRNLISEGFIIQRYDAYSSNSIYLKLDYGVCNSIRISDHPGKKYLKYRYNIGPYVKEFQEVKDKFPRIYYRETKSQSLAGGLRKELIKLNPVLGNDFKGAMEDGAITADLLGQAITNIGMTDMAKEAATSVTTFEGAMGNLEASAVSGMMNLYDTFAKPKVIDAINGMTSKVDAGFSKLAVGIPKAIEIILPYWNVLKTDAKEVGTAFGEAAGAIIDEVQELTGAFGKKESVDNFSESMGTATGALTTFAGFLKEQDKEVAKAIT